MKIKCIVCENKINPEDEANETRQGGEYLCQPCWDEDNEEELSNCCGASIIMTDICSDCKEHI